MGAMPIYGVSTNNIFCQFFFKTMNILVHRGNWTEGLYLSLPMYMEFLILKYLQRQLMAFNKTARSYLPLP